jgi:hypothetical protein
MYHGRQNKGPIGEKLQFQLSKAHDLRPPAEIDLLRRCSLFLELEF